MLPLRRRVPQHTPASVSQATEKRTRLPTSYQHRLSVAARARGRFFQQWRRQPSSSTDDRSWAAFRESRAWPERLQRRRDRLRDERRTPEERRLAWHQRRLPSEEAAIDSSRPDARRRVRFLDRMPCRARAKPLPDSLSVYETFTRKPQPQQRRAENEE